MQILDKIRNLELKGKLIELREKQDEKTKKIKEVGDKVAALSEIIEEEREKIK